MTEDLYAIVREVLEKSYLMSLATTDDGGVWVSDVICIHDDDLNLYWMSDPDARHSKAITIGSPVAGTITVSGAGEMNLGIQFDGKAEKIDGARFDLAVKHYRKRAKPDPREDEDILHGDSWYVLRPRKIDIICERLYGFEKKILEIKTSTNG